MSTAPLPTLVLSAALALTATTAFAAPQSGSVTVNGRDYETITRAFNQNGRTVLTGEVRVRRISWGCDTFRPGHCAEIVQRVLDADQARLVEGVPANAIRQIIRKR